MKDYDKYRTRGAYHYDWYVKKDPEWYRKCVDKCVEFCKGSTLDVGCGDGVVTNLIAQNYDATGVDFDHTAIDLAKMNASRGSYIVHNLEDPLKGKWQYMVCLNVIEHLENPEAIKRIFNRNIAKAAIIITDVPQEHPSPYHIKEFTPYELKQMFHTRKVKHFYIDEEFHGIEVYK